MDKINRRKHVKGTKNVPLFNVSEVRALTDDQIEQAVSKDPDSIIIDPNKFKQKKRSKRIHRNQ